MVIMYIFKAEISSKSVKIIEKWTLINFKILFQGEKNTKDASIVSEMFYFSSLKRSETYIAKFQIYSIQMADTWVCDFSSLYLNIQVSCDAVRSTESYQGKQEERSVSSWV